MRGTNINGNSGGTNWSVAEPTESSPAQATKSVSPASELKGSDGKPALQTHNFPNTPTLKDASVTTFSPELGKMSPDIMDRVAILKDAVKQAEGAIVLASEYFFSAGKERNGTPDLNVLSQDDRAKIMEALEQVANEFPEKTVITGMAWHDPNVGKTKNTTDIFQGPNRQEYDKKTTDGFDKDKWPGKDWHQGEQSHHEVNVNGAKVWVTTCSDNEACFEENKDKADSERPDMVLRPAYAGGTTEDRIPKANGHPTVMSDGLGASSVYQNPISTTTVNPQNFKSVIGDSQILMDTLMGALPESKSQLSRDEVLKSIGSLMFKSKEKDLHQPLANAMATAINQGEFSLDQFNKLEDSNKYGQIFSMVKEAVAGREGATEAEGHRAISDSAPVTSSQPRGLERSSSAMHFSPGDGVAPNSPQELAQLRQSYMQLAEPSDTFRLQTQPNFDQGIQNLQALPSLENFGFQGEMRNYLANIAENFGLSSSLGDNGNELRLNLPSGEAIPVSVDRLGSANDAAAFDHNEGQIFIGSEYLGMLEENRDAFEQNLNNQGVSGQEKADQLNIFDQVIGQHIGSALVHEMTHAKQFEAFDKNIDHFLSWRGNMEYAAHWQQSVATEQWLDSAKDIPGLMEHLNNAQLNDQPVNWLNVMSGLDQYKPLINAENGTYLQHQLNSFNGETTRTGQNDFMLQNQGPTPPRAPQADDASSDSSTLSRNLERQSSDASGISSILSFMATNPLPTTDNRTLTSTDLNNLSGPEIAQALRDDMKTKAGMAMDPPELFRMPFEPKFSSPEFNAPPSLAEANKSEADFAKYTQQIAESFGLKIDHNENGMQFVTPGGTRVNMSVEDSNNGAAAVYSPDSRDIKFNKSFFDGLMNQRNDYETSLKNAGTSEAEIEAKLSGFDEFARGRYGSVMVHELSHAKQHAALGFGLDAEDVALLANLKDSGSDITMQDASMTEDSGAKKMDSWRGQMEYAAHFQESQAMEQWLAHAETRLNQSGFAQDRSTLIGYLDVMQKLDAYLPMLQEENAQLRDGLSPEAGSHATHLGVLNSDKGPSSGKGLPYAAGHSDEGFASALAAFVQDTFPNPAQNSPTGGITNPASTGSIGGNSPSMPAANDGATGPLTSPTDTGTRSFDSSDSGLGLGSEPAPTSPEPTPTPSPTTGTRSLDNSDPSIRSLGDSDSETTARQGGGGSKPGSMMQESRIGGDESGLTGNFGTGDPQLATSGEISAGPATLSGSAAAGASTEYVNDGTNFTAAANVGAGVRGSARIEDEDGNFVEGSAGANVSAGARVSSTYNEDTGLRSTTAGAGAGASADASFAFGDEEDSTRVGVSAAAEATAEGGVRTNENGQVVGAHGKIGYEAGVETEITDTHNGDKGTSESMMSIGADAGLSAEGEFGMNEDGNFVIGGEFDLGPIGAGLKSEWDIEAYEAQADQIDDKWHNGDKMGAVMDTGDMLLDSAENIPYIGEAVSDFRDFGSGLLDGGQALANGDFGGAAKAFGNSALDGLEGILEANPMTKGIMKAIDSLQNGGFEEMVNTLENGFNMTMSSLQSAVDEVTDFAEDVGDTLATGAAIVGEGVKDVAEGAVGVAGDVAEGAVGVAKDVAEGAVDVAEDVAEGAVDVAEDVAEGAVDVAEDVGEGIKDGAEKAWDGFKSIF